MSQSRFAKTRLTVPEFAALCARADEAGMTVSEYIRTLIVQEREQLDIQVALRRIEASMVAQSVAKADPSEVILAEVLLLSREILAGRNVQAVAAVAQKVQALYPAGGR